MATGRTTQPFAYMDTLMTNTKLEVLTPENCQIIFIDQQPQMAFGVQSMDRQALKNNTVGLAKAAKVFNIPTIITTPRDRAAVRPMRRRPRRRRPRTTTTMRRTAVVPARNPMPRMRIR